MKGNLYLLECKFADLDGFKKNKAPYFFRIEASGAKFLKEPKYYSAACDKMLFEMSSWKKIFIYFLSKSGVPQFERVPQFN